METEPTGVPSGVELGQTRRPVDEARLLPPRVADFFVSLLPNAEGPILIDGASHFLQEDRPDEVAAAINAFLAR